MSKYDFEIDISQNSSTGIILNKINRGAVVLEFGCAAGRMTRYMKEVLECQVYIVEYDKSAYEVALKYAEDGLCDDILNFQWVEKFKGIEFDAIIFADVLEHLISPEKVLEKASKLLKNAGCIYASIPNITHNDILLKANEEHFDYTSTGLLDDTHVHFWGLKNIEMFSSKCGLNIRNIEGTYCPTGFTEQYAEAGTKGNILLENILRERQCGEVYQFIITLDKNEGVEATHTFKAPFIKSHIYLDTGKDFNANEIIDFDSEYSGKGSYIAHYVINNTGKINRVRFDPIELQGCILRHISMFQGNKKLSLIYPDAIEMEEGILLLGNDPMVYANVLSKDEPIIIDADIVILGQKYIQIVQEAYVNKCSEFKLIQGEVGSLTIEKNELQGNVADLTRDNAGLRGEVARLNEENEELRGETAWLTGETARLNGENADLRRDIGAYIILANNKDKYALELEQALNVKNQYVLELEQALNYYKSLRVVRLRAYIGRIWRGIKRRVKRVLGKEER